MTQREQKQIVEDIGKAYGRYLATRDLYVGRECPHMKEVEGMVHILFILRIPYTIEWDHERNHVKKFTIGDYSAFF